MKVNDNNITATKAAARALGLETLRSMAAFAVEQRDRKTPGDGDFFILLEREDKQVVVHVVGEEVEFALAEECSIPKESWRSPQDGFWTDN